MVGLVAGWAISAALPPWRGVSAHATSGDAGTHLASEGPSAKFASGEILRIEDEGPTDASPPWQQSLLELKLWAGGSWNEEQLIDFAYSIEASELPAAMSAVAQTLSGDGRMQVAKRLLVRWTRIDPSAAMAYAKSLPESALRRSGVETVLKTWVTRDPEAVAREFENVLPGAEKEKLSVQLLERLAAASPDQALAMIDRFGPSSPGGERQRALVRGWALKDPVAAGAYALAHGCADYYTVASVASAWAVTDPRAAIAWATSTPGFSVALPLAADLAAMTYEVDPTLAMKLAVSVLDDNYRGSAFLGMVVRALDRNLEEARRLVEVIPDDAARTHCAVAVSVEMSEIDPRGAVDWIDDQVNTCDKEYILSDALGRWASVEPKSAADWAIRHMTNADMRILAMDKILSGWAANTPKDAVAFVASMAEGSERSSCSRIVASGWGLSDPPAALDWIGAHSDPTVLDAADWVISQWSGRDRAGVEAWLQSQENGAVRDRAVAAFSEALEMSDPVGALKWALTIPDQDVRATRTERAAGVWLRVDREAATRWISESGLSEEAKARLIRP